MVWRRVWRGRGLGIFLVAALAALGGGGQSEGEEKRRSDAAEGHASMLLDDARDAEVRRAMRLAE